MDSLTHIYFAEKLLRITGRNRSAAVCSLFPQIDRAPAYFHRMYGHPFFQIPRLAPIAMSVYADGEIPEEHVGEYAWSRYLEERPRMQGFVEEFERETGVSITPFDCDHVSMIIGWTSHTYQDIFNNPMQGFLPRSVYPSGKWELWASLDAIDFRSRLYQPENIAAFREEFFSDPLWNVTLDPAALVYAMVIRTATASIVQIPRQLVDSAFEGLGVGPRPSDADLTAALDFIIEHEELLARLMRKHSEALPVAVGAGVEVAANFPTGS